MRKMYMRRQRFAFAPFSERGKQAMLWWQPHYISSDSVGIIADGSVRSGKTISFICGFLLWSQRSFVDSNFAICGKSYPSIHRNVVSELKKILNTWQWSYKDIRDPKVGQGIQIGSNIYYYFEFNNEGSAGRIQGLTLAGALIDEATLAPSSFFEMALTRLSLPGSRFWANCNPDSPHHYIKKEYIDKARDKNILYLHFTMDDNLSLSQEIKDKYKSLFSGMFYQRYVLGLWVAAEGVIYDFFSEDTHTKNITAHKGYKYYIGIDYGTSSVTVFVLFGIEEDTGKCWAEKEYYYDAVASSRQKTDQDLLDDLRDFSNGYDIAAIIIDPSAASFKVLISYEFFSISVNPEVINAANAVINGIRIQMHMLQTGKYIINKACVHTIKDYYSYVWDKKAQLIGLDKPLKVNDHTKDVERYFLYTIFGSTYAYDAYARQEDAKNEKKT